jgi:hypothetical protein
VSGVASRRGRRHTVELRVGDALGFWRVEAIERDHLLRLRAEVKVPGAVWLQFETQPHGERDTLLVLTALSLPKDSAASSTGTACTLSTAGSSRV